jgi:hypothetical protein
MTSLGLPLGPEHEPPPDPDPNLYPAPHPLLPELQVWQGVAPVEISVRKSSRNGQEVARVDIDEADLPPLPAGTYWLVALWPAGAGRARWFPGGVRRHLVMDPPPAPLPPPAPSGVDPTLVRILETLAGNQAQLGSTLASIDARLAKIEATPTTTAAAATVGGLTPGLVERLLERALTPPVQPPAQPPPDVIAQAKGLLGLMGELGSWAQHGGPPPRDPSSGELAIQVLDRVGTAVEKLPEAYGRMRALMPQPAPGQPAPAPGQPPPPQLAAPTGPALATLASLTPRQLAAELSQLPAEALGAWLADAVCDGVLPDELLEPINVDALGEALHLGPEMRGRLAAAISYANQITEPDPAAQQPPPPVPPAAPAPAAPAPDPAPHPARGKGRKRGR